MPIKKGDKLILTQQGIELAVEAASDEKDGMVVIKQRGTFAAADAKHLRLDTAADADPSAAIQITGNQPDPQTMSVKCPDCGGAGSFVPPNWVDHKRRKLIVKYQCPKKHIWHQEYDLK